MDESDVVDTAVESSGIRTVDKGKNVLLTAQVDPRTGQWSCLFCGQSSTHHGWTDGGFQVIHVPLIQKIVEQQSNSRPFTQTPTDD